MFDKAKMLYQAQKIQKELEKAMVEGAAGDGAVTVQMNCKLEVKKVSIDPDKADMSDVAELGRFLQKAFNEAAKQAQQLAYEKSKPIMGNLDKLGLS